MYRPSNTFFQAYHTKWESSKLRICFMSVEILVLFYAWLCCWNQSTAVSCNEHCCDVRRQRKSQEYKDFSRNLCYKLSVVPKLVLERLLSRQKMEEKKSLLKWSLWEQLIQSAKLFSKCKVVWEVHVALERSQYTKLERYQKPHFYRFQQVIWKTKLSLTAWHYRLSGVTTCHISTNEHISVRVLNVFKIIWLGFSAWIVVWWRDRCADI